MNLINAHTPEAVAERLRDGMAGGVLSFPLTSFGDNGDLDPDSYRTYLGTQLAAAPGAVFPACGTGEFGALDEDEYRSVVTTAVEVAGGRVPVVAGIGYGWAQAPDRRRDPAAADRLPARPGLVHRRRPAPDRRDPDRHRPQGRAQRPRPAAAAHPRGAERLPLLQRRGHRRNPGWRLTGLALVGAARRLA